MVGKLHWMPRHVVRYLRISSPLTSLPTNAGLRLGMARLFASQALHSLHLRVGIRVDAESLGPTWTPRAT